MIRHGRVLVALGLAGSMAGCTPSFQHLVASRRYADAICFASTAEEAAAVVALVERDADPRLNLYPVHEPELAAVMGEEAARRVLGEALLLRVQAGHAALSVNSVDVAVLIERRAEGEKAAAAAYPIGATAGDGWLGLASLTRERPPGSSSYTTVDEKELGLAVFTLGVSRLFSSKPIFQTVEQNASPAEWEAAMPRAAVLARGLSAGGRAEGYALREEPGHELQPKLLLTASDSLNDGGPCELGVSYDLAVPPLRPSAAPALDALFGTQMRALRELPVSARSYWLSNPFGRWSGQTPETAGD